MGPLKAPLEKLPLIARKNVREAWDAKKPEYEGQLSEILGTAWTIHVNPNLIYAYADDSYKDRIGTVITWYIEPFVSNLKRFIGDFGDDGKAEMNTVCSNHQLVFAPQETTGFSYGGLEVKDGILRLVFHENNLGTNTSDVSQDFATALKDAPAAAVASGFNIVARNSVREKYDPSIEQVRSTIAELVNMPSLKLNPNFEGNARALATSADKNPSWDQQIGQATLDYFKAVQYQLEQDKFKDDDMLQEGFQESVTKGEICFRVVDRLNKGTYNECLVEDGVLYLQTMPKCWWSNVDDVASQLMDLL